MRSFSASRARSRSRIPPGPNLCAPARDLPCSFIWSPLNSSDRSGDSSPACHFADPLPRRLAPAWRQFARMVLPPGLTFDVSFYLYFGSGFAFQQARSSREDIPSLLSLLSLLSFFRLFNNSKYPVLYRE